MKTSKNTSATLLERRAVKIGLASFFCLVITLSGVAQPANKCLSFNGTNSVVNFTDEVAVPNNVTNLAISAWVNWSSKANAGSNAVILAISDTVGNNGQFWLQHNADNSKFQFVFQTDSLVKITVNSTTNPIAGNWYNVAGVFDGSSINLYVNGYLEGSALLPDGQKMNASDTNYNMTIGAGYKLTNQFNGLLDEVAMWNKSTMNQTLPAAYSFYDMMCIGLNFKSPDLISYWNMDSLINDSVFDIVLGGDGDGDIAFDAVCSNVTILNGGAPVANNATHLTGSSPFVYINSVTGDSLVIDSLGSVPNGVYVYEINAAPTDSLMPSGVTASCASYYYGIFIPGYQSGSYTVTYYYPTTRCDTATGHRQSASSPVLLNKNAQSSFNWVISNAVVDLSSSKFSVVIRGGQNEFMLGKLNNALGTENNTYTTLKVTGINPNPFSTNFSLAINCKKNTTLKARIISADGKFISESVRFCNTGENQLNFENMSEIASGVYFLNLNDGEGYTTHVKMVKN